MRQMRPPLFVMTLAVLSSSAAAAEEASVPPFKAFRLGQEEDGSWLRLRLTAQVIDRRFLEDEEKLVADTFVPVRVRPYIEGVVWKYFGFRVMPDFGSGRVTLEDAYIDLNAYEFLRLRVGKQKTPFGLERLQSD